MQISPQNLKFSAEEAKEAATEKEQKASMAQEQNTLSAYHVDIRV